MLYLLRHGQTAANRSGLLQGHVDFDLTELGKLQAKAAADALRDRDVQHLVSSPLRRAVQTAEIVSASLGLAVELESRLIEMDYGLWDERPLTDISETVWAQWRIDPDFAPPGGESLRSVSHRTVAFATETAASERSTIAVSHVSPIKAAVAWSLGCDEAVTWRMHLNVASISAVGMRGSSPYLASFNQTPLL